MIGSIPELKKANSTLSKGKNLALEKVKKLSLNIGNYAFFMSFPSLLLFGINFSLLYFIQILRNSNGRRNKFNSNYTFLILSVLFGLGSVISVIDVNETSSTSMNRAMVVLPNYLYWCIMVILLASLRKSIDFTVVAKKIFFGLCVTVVYYQIHNYLPKAGLFLNSISPNNYSFLCICFSAPAAYYLKTRYSIWVAFAFVVLILITLLGEGRRAGLILVFVSTMITLAFHKINIKNAFVSLTLFFVLQLTMQLPSVEHFFLLKSPRVHELIYENKNIATEDRSYLVRVLMVEKALIIFEDNPLTGIGLNNFSNYHVSFRGDFEGSEFVINKQSMNEKSAHNSYAFLLAEGGLLIFVPFIGIILFNIFHFVKGFNRRSALLNSFYWAFIAMCIHLYFISALLNVYAWFLIGIVSAISLLNTDRVNKRPFYPIHIFPNSEHENN